MSHVSMRTITVLSLLGIAGSPALSADPPSKTQLERLMETASQTPDRPDHDYATNSIEALLRQSQELKFPGNKRTRSKPSRISMTGPGAIARQPINAARWTP